VVDNLKKTLEEEPNVSTTDRTASETAQSIPAAARVRRPVHFVKKGWGSELWLANGELYCGKILRFDQGKKCSMHYHKIKTETFYLHSGRLILRIMNSAEAEVVEELVLEAGQCMDIPPGLVHQMEALEDAELFEFSTEHFEEDSYRLIKGD
jgi:mannose-6-phosphate isomerase-like protein (cupin superfamily)